MQFRFTDHGVPLEGPNFCGEIARALVQGVRETEFAVLLLFPSSVVLRKKSGLRYW